MKTNQRRFSLTHAARHCVIAGLLSTTTTIAASSPAWAEAPYVNNWIKQLGTSTHDYSSGVSADGLGNVFISGSTIGSLGGPNAGREDAYVSKYDAAGNLSWTKQVGTSNIDFSLGVSADGLGNVFISGQTRGSLDGPNAGGEDAFVSKFDGAGNLAWTKQLGTSSDDRSFGVSADGLGNVFISGFTRGSLGGPNAGDEDAFVSKYDGTGNLAWTKQLGTNSTEFGYGVSADGLGNVFISGFTRGSLGGPSAGLADAFVSKYDGAGNLTWTKQLGTSSGDGSLGVSADGLGNVFISGETSGSLGGPNSGGFDAFVSKFDGAGNLSWTKQLGTISIDRSLGVSADGLGNVFISGFTTGSLDGPNTGGEDAFVSKFDGAGNLAWTKQLGTSSDDRSFGVSADGLGSVFISGFTRGSLGGPNAGDEDAFVARFSPNPVPEPSTWAVGALAALGLGVARLRRRRAK